MINANKSQFVLTSDIITWVFTAVENVNYFSVEVINQSVALRAAAENHGPRCPGQLTDAAESGSVGLCGAGHSGVHLGSGSLVSHIQTTDQAQPHLG